MANGETLSSGKILFGIFRAEENWKKKKKEKKKKKKKKKKKEKKK